MNARIKSVEITLDRGKFFCCWVHLEMEGCGVSLGGRCLDRPGPDSRVGTAYGAEYIRRLMTTFEVEKLSALKGQIVRTRWNGDGGWGDEIAAIGHPIKDKWFDPTGLLEEMADETN